MACTSHRLTADGIWLIPAQSAADLVCQTAFRLARGNAEKMLALLQKERTEGLIARTPRGGGAFMAQRVRRLDVPGCDFYTAHWQEQFIVALEAHIANLQPERKRERER